MDDLDVKRLNLSGAVVFHGPSVEVNKLIAMFKEFALRNGVRVIFATTSSRRLFVKQEGVEP